jgi:hypothetical protein
MFPIGSRTRSLVAGALGGVLMLTGCVSSAPEVVLPSGYAESPTVVSDGGRVSPDASAYAAVSDFLMTRSYLPHLLDPTVQPTEEDLTAGIVEAMEPETAAEWRALVSRDLLGDESARAKVRLLRFHTWDTPDSRLPRGNPLVAHTITNSSVQVPTSAEPAPHAADRVVEVSLVDDAYVRHVARNIFFTVHVSKSLTLGMVPDPDRPGEWLIQTFDGTLEIKIYNNEP